MRDLLWMSSGNAKLDNDCRDSADRANSATYDTSAHHGADSSRSRAQRLKTSEYGSSNDVADASLHRGGLAACSKPPGSINLPILLQRAVNSPAMTPAAPNPTR